MVKTKAIMVGLLGMSAFLVGCSNESDCLTSDTLQEVATADDARAIYLRVSGLQEKEFFYELYDREPTFDRCGTADIKPLSVSHIDREQGAPSAINVYGSSVDVAYSEESDAVSEASLINVKVVIR